MVRIINGEQEFNEAINSKQLVVVDYTATWCGPCRGIAPKYEELSYQYTDVVFLKVDADQNQDIIASQGIRAFPTFHFFINGLKIDEMRGANSTELENKINQHKGSASGGSFTGVGHKLGWDGVGMPPVPSAVEVKEARLRALETRNIPTVSSRAPPVAAKETEIVDEEKLMLKKAMEMSQGNSDISAATATAAEMKEDMDDEFVPAPVDESILKELTSMGFHEVRSRKSIVHGKTLEGALEWLDAHQDDANIDLEPYMVRRADAISQGTNAVPLTEEQKAAKVEELKQRILKRKEERALQEKKDAIRIEKERRERGQTLTQVQEERDRAIRRRELEKQKKEKEMAVKERARLKALIQADKEERRKHGGVLPSVLGSEGYNPSAIAEGSITGARDSGVAVSTASATSATTSTLVSVTSQTPVLDASTPIEYKTTPNEVPITAEMLGKVDNLIQTVARYKVGKCEV